MTFPRWLGRQWVGVGLAIFVFLMALGNLRLRLYPYGVAVWVQPLLSLIGIIGAIALVIGSAWWRALLLVWCTAQTLVVATDPSGEWFDQGLWIGERSTRSVRISGVLTDYSASGLNYAGLILLAVTAAVIVFELHPPVRRPIRRRQARIVLATIGAVVVALLGTTAWRWWDQRNAIAVINTDLPFVPIYYKGTLLGHTPLAITPERIKQWGLPISTTGRTRVYSWGWADVEMLTDGTQHVPLYAGVPWFWSEYCDTFPTPWGERCRFHVGSDETKVQQFGRLMPAAALRDEPIVRITRKNPGPLRSGDPLVVHVEVTNPTTRHFRGARATIDRLCFTYGPRAMNTPGAKRRPEVTLPDDWRSIAPGSSRSADITFESPATPDDYELFCVLNLFESDSGSGLVEGSVYSNMLMLTVLP